MQTPASQGPASSQPRAPQTPVVAGQQPSGVELEALNTRKSVLSGELASLTQRRQALSEQLMTANGLNRVGLERQITQLDQLIMQVQSDLDATVREQAGAPVRFTTVAQPPRAAGPSANDVAMMGIGASMVLLFPFAIVLARRLWRKPVAPAIPQDWQDTPARMRHLEQAVDAIAIEVERISESQRFMTRLMSETRRAEAVGGNADSRALPAGVAPAEPLVVRERERA